MWIYNDQLLRSSWNFRSLDPLACNVGRCMEMMLVKIKTNQNETVLLHLAQSATICKKGTYRICTVLHCQLLQGMGDMSKVNFKDPFLWPCWVPGNAYPVNHTFRGPFSCDVAQLFLKGLGIGLVSSRLQFFKKNVSILMNRAAWLWVLLCCWCLNHAWFVLF